MRISDWSSDVCSSDLFTLGAAQIGGGTQNLEIITTVTHAEPGATSRQIVRSVLGGTATGTYLGKVAVARDAQRTDSEQDVKAMLLNLSATAHAKPEHRTFADDDKVAQVAPNRQDRKSVA